MPAQHDYRVRRLRDTDNAFPLFLEEAAHVLLAGFPTDRVSPYLICDWH
jgi:hypothetical protein